MNDKNNTDTVQNPVRATPEERVIAMAKKWREAEKASIASKNEEDARKENFARRALRDAIDRLP